MSKGRVLYENVVALGMFLVAHKDVARNIPLFFQTIKAFREHRLQPELGELKKNGAFQSEIQS